MSTWSLTCRQSVFKWHQSNTLSKSFTHKMTAETSLHRYGTKLRHCRPMCILLQPFNGLFSRTTWVSRYQKGKTNLDFTGARDSEWQWHQLSHMQVCTSLQTDNHASTPPLCFYRPDALPAAQPTASKHWRQWPYYIFYYYLLRTDWLQQQRTRSHSSRTAVRLMWTRY